MVWVVLVGDGGWGGWVMVVGVVMVVGDRGGG